SGTISFAVAPTIDPVTGELKFTVAGDAYGTATISVGLGDDGSGAPPNDSFSDVQEFTLTVNPINDEQEITVNSTRTVDRGSSRSINNDYLITHDPDDSPANLIY